MVISGLVHNFYAVEISVLEPRAGLGREWIVWHAEHVPGPSPGLWEVPTGKVVSQAWPS